MKHMSILFGFASAFALTTSTSQAGSAMNPGAIDWDGPVLGGPVVEDYLRPIGLTWPERGLQPYDPLKKTGPIVVERPSGGILMHFEDYLKSTYTQAALSEDTVHTYCTQVNWPVISGRKFSTDPNYKSDIVGELINWVDRCDHIPAKDIKAMRAGNPNSSLSDLPIFGWLDTSAPASSEVWDVWQSAVANFTMPDSLSGCTLPAEKAGRKFVWLGTCKAPSFLDWALHHQAGIDVRCENQDSQDVPHSLGRVEWSEKCNHMTAKLATWCRSGSPTNGLPFYPMYGWLNVPAPLESIVWVAPTAYEKQSDGKTNCAIPGKDSAGNSTVMLGICRASCYTPEQRLYVFNEGKGQYMSILDAITRRVPQIMTLTPQSTLDDLQLMQNDVDAYVAEMKEGHVKIVELVMQSGGKLRVTLNHPLVVADGSIRDAEHLTIGESLIRVSGELDPIVSIEQKDFFGRVFNVKPKTEDPVSNIVIAEGYLNGSSRFQNEYIRDVNRIILRETLLENTFVE